MTGRVHFDGLSVFGFTINDGFFEGAMGLIFTDMTIEEVVDPGCGVSTYGEDVGNTIGLSATGDATPGSTLTLEISGSGPGTMVGISMSPAELPIVSVVGLIDPMALTGMFVVPSPGGSASVPITVPDAPGMIGYFQAWAPIDGKSGIDFLASNGLQVEICPE